MAPLAAGAQQQVDVAELLRCSALPTAADKLACYEALTRQVQPAALPELDVAPVPAGEPVELLPEVPAVVNAVPEIAPAPPPEDLEPRPVPPLAAETPSVAPVAQPAEINNDDSSIHTVEVVKVARRNLVLYFEFANGETWRQMKADRIAYPRSRAFEVEIRRGFMGDHQLRVEGKGRMTRIVRVQ